MNLQDVDRIEVSKEYPGTIKVTSLDGAWLFYAMHNGTFLAGRPWVTLAEDGHKVKFFLPFPDGQPMLLSVEGCKHDAG